MVIYPLVIWLTVLANWKPWPIEIVDLPIENGDVPSFFVSLPEGNKSGKLAVCCGKSQFPSWPIGESSNTKWPCVHCLR